MLDEQARPFCQASGVRHVLLQTDHHAVLVLFNKDHTAVTFSHIEDLDLREEPLASIDALAPLTPNPSLFTMVAQTMVDCRESAASGVVETTSFTSPGASDSVSLLRFPFNNFADTPSTDSIVEPSFLRLALNFELEVKEIEAELQVEASVGDNEIDADGEDEEMDADGEDEGTEGEEVDAEDLIEPVVEVAQTHIQLPSMDYQPTYQPNEAVQFAEMLATLGVTSVDLEYQPLIAMHPEMVEGMGELFCLAHSYLVFHVVLSDFFFLLPLSFSST